LKFASALGDPRSAAMNSAGVRMVGRFFFVRGAAMPLSLSRMASFTSDAMARADGRSSIEVSRPR
jgi:hypothetical protein